MSEIIEALKVGVNASGAASLITGLFLVMKSKSDMKLALRQMESQGQLARRDDDRDDNKQIIDAYNTLLTRETLEKDKAIARADRAESDLRQLKDDVALLKEAWARVGETAAKERILDDS